MAKLSYEEWLAKHGYDDCAGCEFNIISQARCTFPGRYCVEYLRVIGKKPQKKQKNFL